MPARSATRANSASQAALAPGDTAYMRALAMRAMSGEAQALPDAEPRRLLDERVAEGDVAEAQAAVPEQDGLVVALPPGPEPRHDLPHLGVERALAELAGLDMGAQRPETAGLALAPIVHDELGHDVRERQLHGAHGAVGHDEGARFDPFGPEQR